MSKASLILSEMQARVLQALRAGRLEYGQLEERFGGHGATHARALEHAGLVSRTSDGFEITARGRELCPSRRAIAGLEKPAPAQIPEAPSKPAPEETTPAVTVRSASSPRTPKPTTGRARAVAFVHERGQATAAELAALIGCSTKSIYPRLAVAVSRGQVSIRSVVHPWSGRPINIYERPGLKENTYEFQKQQAARVPAVFDPLPDGGWRIQRGGQKVELSRDELAKLRRQIDQGGCHAQ